MKFTRTSLCEYFVSTVCKFDKRRRRSTWTLAGPVRSDNVRVCGKLRLSLQGVFRQDGTPEKDDLYTRQEPQDIPGR